MSTADLVLAIDQGTTSTRSIVFDTGLRTVAHAQEEFRQHFPHSGWVEHAAEDLWKTTRSTMTRAAEDAGGAGRIAAIGITNQRETTLLWDAETGEAVHNAIVWQDRRTASFCRTLKEEGFEKAARERTGLLLDPYFSGTKAHWLLQNVEGAQELAASGRLRFGTVDSWLIWKLTEGRRFVTDVTNAARTLLYDIRRQAWDPDLMERFGVTEAMLPEVLDCADEFGTTTVLGREIPILGVAGDQQAASIGQACFWPGMLKSTYGTGCFALLNIGETPLISENRLLTTIAARLDGRTTYALEGSIFVAGAVVQWLRDGLGLIGDAAETGALADVADPEQEVILVPAFTGLGAPYWDADARGAIFGLTRSTGSAELTRAALESVAFQTRDLVEAMLRDWQEGEPTVLRVDGGMAASDWTLQRIADLLAAPVDRPQTLETTALGAAWLAGWKAGLYPDPEGFSEMWACDRRFEPSMDDATRNARYELWKDAVRRTLTS